MSKTIMRVEKNKENPYLMLNRTCSQDVRLSWKAKGIHTYLLGLPDNWKIYMDELKNHSVDGRESTASGIKELIEYGYITRRKLQGEKGRFEGYEYIVFEWSQNISVETPNTDTEPVTPESGKPVDGLTVVGEPATTEYLPKQITKKQNNNNKKKKETKPKEPKTENPVVVEIINSFSEKYKGTLAPNFVADLIKQKGIDHVKKHLEDFAEILEGAEIKTGIEQLFTYTCKNGWQKSTKPKTAPRKTNYIEQHVNFKQREYSDEHFDSLYTRPPEA